jgi:hypothetical protein
MDSDRKRQLDTVLLPYNFSAIVHFPTRVQNQSKMAVDHVFVNNHKITNYTVSPIYSGLSDHGAQLITVKNVNLHLFKRHIYTIRNIHKCSIKDFKIRVSYESWDSIFGSNDSMDGDMLFNTFLNNCLKNILYKFFPSECN